MKTKLLLIGGIIGFFCSCSSSHRLGQRPDDVYYSPAPPQVEYVTTGSQEEMDNGYNNSYNSYLSMNNSYSMYPDALSFGLGYGYNSLFNYYGSPFFSPYNSFYSPYSPIISFSPYYNYNSFYYPSYSGIYGVPGFYNSVVVYNTKPGSVLSNYSGPRRYNLAAYTSSANVPIIRTVSQTANNTIVPTRNVNTSRSNSSGVGNFFRRVFTTSDNNRSFVRPNSNNDNFNNRSNNIYNNNNTNTSTRSFQQGAGFSGRSSSGSASSGGSAPARSFRR